MDFPDLVRLFAAHRVDDIDTVPEYRDLCTAYADNGQFWKQRHTTEIAKKAIEAWLNNQPNYAAEVRQSIVILQGRRRTIDFDVFRALIVAGYKPRWSSDQQNYFDRLLPTILTDNDFFLSFTSRGPAVGYKRINQRYWYFISRKIGGDNITQADRKTRNLLAEACYANLVDASLKGFYYVLHENDNAIVLKKLREGLQGSRVFVQLVENIMFDLPDGRANYCEYEYRGAVEIIREEERILFVVAEERPDDLEDPARVPITYRDWMEHIRSKAAAYLPPVENYDTQKITAIENKLRDIVLKVKAARRSVLDQVPG